MAYAVYCPTRIIFSDDARADLGRELAALPPGPVLVVTDAGVISAGILGRVLPESEAAEAEFEVFSEVPGNPGVGAVAAVLERTQARGVVAVVAIGGGSAIDVAKAVSVLLAHPGLCWEDLQTGSAGLAAHGAPLIAVPTTAGTGSEVSHVAVIGAVDGFKKGVVHASLFPTAAIVDPSLALSLPPRLTAATGMDALVHAIEAYLGRRANPSMDLLALGALETITRALPAAVADGSDMSARREMAQAAVWAGMAMDQAGLGLCHAVCGPLSAHHGVHHGLGNALLLPAVLEFNFPAIPSQRWRRLRAALGMPGEAGPEALVPWARAFVGGLGLPTRLEEIGVNAADLPTLAAEAPRMAMIGNNIRPAGEAECLAVLRAAM